MKLYGVLAMTILFFLCGCTNLLRQEQPSRQYYALELPTPEKGMQTPVFKGTLLVGDMTVSPAFSSRNLVYRMEGGTYESDYYNLFLVDPAEMVTQETREWLRESNLFASVIGQGSRLENEYSLEGNIIELYGDFSGGEGRSVIKIQFFLLEHRGEGQKLRLQRNYSRSMDVDKRSAAALVRSYNRGLEAILSELTRDLTGLGI